MLRPVLADAAVAFGATLLLLQVGAPARSAALVALGLASILAGAAAYWGVPREGFRVRLASSLGALLTAAGVHNAQQDAVGPGLLVAGLGLAVVGIALIRSRRA